MITVCPGLMRTDSTERAEFRGRQDEEHAWFALADRLPGLSMDATRAAEQIVDACVRNKSELVLTLPASIAARAYGLFPSLVLTAESVVNRLLPQPSPGHAIKG